MGNETITTTLELPAELNEALRALAAEDRGSVNSTVITALEAFVAARTQRVRVVELSAEVAARHAELLLRLA